jgi:hypothetical protein
LGCTSGTREIVVEPGGREYWMRVVGNLHRFRSETYHIELGDEGGGGGTEGVRKNVGERGGESGE